MFFYGIYSDDSIVLPIASTSESSTNYKDPNQGKTQLFCRSKNLKNAHLTPIFRLYNIHLVFSACPHNTN